MKKIFSSPFFWQFIAALLALTMLNTPLAMPGILVDKGPSWLGLDVSWNMTLNYAVIKNWVWGKDIICTYGPLAWAATRTGWGISKWFFVLFDGFVVVNFYFVFLDVLKNNSDKFFAMAILICSMFIVNPFFGSDLSWVMLFFIIYWMIRTYHDPRPAFLIILIVLTVSAFYIKINTGLIAIVFLLLHFINLFIHKKVSLIKLLVYLTSFVAMVGISAMIMHVSIVGYITGSLETIKGYNDIMYLDEDHHRLEHNLCILFGALMLWFLFKLWVQIRKKKYSLILHTVACILYIFLLQKQSMLRNDVQHLHEFFSFAPLILLCGFNFLDGQKPYLKYLLVMMLFALFFVAEERTIDEAFNRRIKNPTDYIKGFRSYSSVLYADQPDKRYIPKRVLNVIGNKTVDVFPWDSEYALENKLNYKPRPAFQSYAAYTADLENTNYDSYVKQAPDVLLYSYDTIDGRYAFNDESLVNMFVLKNYTLVDTFTSNERTRIVLQRNKKTVPPIFKELKKHEVFALNKEITVEGSNFIKLDLRYSLAGKAKFFFNKPPHLQICYMRQDGQWSAFKTSTELLRAGVYVGDLVTNDNEYISLLAGKHQATIKKIRFNYDDKYFKSDGIMDTYFVNCAPDTLLKH